MGNTYFRGKLKKIVIDSNNYCYGTMPLNTEETEQRLVIEANGSVHLTRSLFDTKPIDDINLQSPQENIDAIIRTFEVRFSRDPRIIHVTDVGTWQMVLTNDNDEEFEFTGPLLMGETGDFSGLSDYVREELGREDLFVFDGNPDRIIDITIKYSRTLKAMPKSLPGNGPSQPVTWTSTEELVIDRKSETLSINRKIAEECSETRTLHVAEGISSLLDEFYPDIFDKKNPSPDDLVYDPNMTRNYEIVLHTKHGEEKQIEGTFDKTGLPTEWAFFIEKVYDFMAFYGIGELFDYRIYNKSRRRKSDYIFCDVSYENGGKTYCYISDDDSIEIDDMVLVPVGKDNKEKKAYVVKKDYYSYDDAPYPVEQTKHIIRKIDKSEIDNYMVEGRSPEGFIKTETGDLGSFKINRQEDGTIKITQEDYDVECFDGMCVEVTYTLNSANAQKLFEILRQRHQGTLEDMMVEEFGIALEKQSFSAFCGEREIEYETFTWYD